MAMEVLADVADALGQKLAPRLFQQWNRSAVALSIIPAIPYRGKNCAWDAEFSGDVDATNVQEGSDVGAGEFDSDEDEDAVLSWATYRKSFQITEQAIDAAATSDGVASDDLVDLFNQRALAQGARLASRLNKDIYTGTGTSGGFANLVGLFGGATDASGTYATLSRSSRTEWAGNAFANGGTPRALTANLLYQADQAMFDDCGEPATHILCSSGVHRKYAGLFENVRRLSTDGRGPMAYNLGASDLFFKGIPVVRDKDCPAGKLIFINTNYCRVQFLPRAGVPNDAVMQQMKTMMGSTGSPNAIPTATAIPYRLALLAKTGDSIKASLKLTLQFVVNRPNAFCQILDIDES